MTYKEKFVAVIKNKGKILRERGSVVTLPFGSEYSILLKNLESRRAVVNVSIDGKDVLGGQSIIIQANSTLELKEFVSGLKGKNHFKFIQKTKQIADYRGDRVDDGLVRIEFKFEKDRPVYIYRESISEPRTRRWPIPRYDEEIMFSCNYTDASTRLGCLNKKAAKITSSTTPLSDEGITVKGSPSSRRFEYGHVGELENSSSVIVIKLRGANESGVKVRRTITTKTKLVCNTCGNRSKSNAKYCRNCGTYLEQ